ncbi:MAG: GEVED domain-containing protein [Gammaproteobacteria bacterium]|nr:GEVED domain-containing protein [Gammaproteobacteria bacterium]
MKKYLLIVAVYLLAITSSPAWSDRLYMLSQPSDYIGQGLTTDISSETHSFAASVNFDAGVSVSINGTAFWNLDFAAAGSVQLTPGNYENATRFPFQSLTDPGLAVGGNGRGCNTLTGRFTVLEVVYNPDNTVAQFAADFEQHCEGLDPALFGAIRINSQIPINVTIPEVTAVAGSDRSTLENKLIQLDGSGSHSNDGSLIVSYLWTQLAGTPVTITNADTPLASFTTPTVPLGGDTLVIQLETLSSSGAGATDEVMIQVLSKSDPLTYIRMDSEPGDYIGQGLSYFFSPNEGVISTSSTDPDVLNVSFSGNHYWSFGFAAPDGTGLNAGTYLDATRYPFHGTGAGLSVSGAGRGCNTLTGNFTVRYISRDTTGVNSFAGDFEQHCEGGPSALRGEVVYQFLDPSIPVANAGADQQVPGGESVQLDALASVDNDGTLVAYQWEQVSGTPVDFQPVDSVVTAFTAPPLPVGTTEELVFKVTVTDDQGFMAEDTVSVLVTGVGLTPNYCSAYGINTYFEWIEKVTVNGFVQLSGDNGGYGDHTGATVFALDKTTSNNLTLTPGYRYGAYTEYWTVWIDSNQDGEFSAIETVFSGTAFAAISTSITLPGDSLSGETRMRVALRYGSQASACGSFYWGEVDDYTVQIQ